MNLTQYEACTEKIQFGIYIDLKLQIQSFYKLLLT